MKKNLFIIALLFGFTLTGCNNPYPDSISIDDSFDYAKEHFAVDSPYTSYTVAYSNFVEIDKQPAGGADNEGTIINNALEENSNSRLLSLPLRIDVATFDYIYDEEGENTGRYASAATLLFGALVRDPLIEAHKIVIREREGGGLTFNTYDTYTEVPLANVQPGNTGFVTPRCRANITLEYDEYGYLVKEYYINSDFYRDELGRKIECFAYYLYN